MSDLKQCIREANEIWRTCRRLVPFKTRKEFLAKVEEDWKKYNGLTEDEKKVFVAGQKTKLESLLKALEMHDEIKKAKASKLPIT